MSGTSPVAGEGAVKSLETDGLRRPLEGVLARGQTSVAHLFVLRRSIHPRKNVPIQTRASARVANPRTTIASAALDDQILDQQGYVRTVSPAYTPTRPRRLR